MYDLGLDLVIIIQEENNPLGNICNIIDYLEENILNWRWLRRLKRFRCAQERNWILSRDLVESSDQIGQESSRVVISFIQRKPSNPEFIYLVLAQDIDPFAGQGGLPKPAGAGISVSFLLTPWYTFFNNPRSGHKSFSSGRNIKFCNKDSTSHEIILTILIIDWVFCPQGNQSTHPLIFLLTIIY